MPMARRSTVARSAAMTMATRSCFTWGTVVAGVFGVQRNLCRGGIVRVNGRWSFNAKSELQILMWIKFKRPRSTVCFLTSGNVWVDLPQYRGASNRETRYLDSPGASLEELAKARNQETTDERQSSI